MLHHNSVEFLYWPKKSLPIVSKSSHTSKEYTIRSKNCIILSSPLSSITSNRCWVSLNIKVSILSKIYAAANQQPSTEQISHHVGRAGANQNHALQFIQFQSYAIDVQATNQSELTTPFHHNEQKSNRNNCTNPRHRIERIRRHKEKGAIYQPSPRTWSTNRRTEETTWDRN